MERNIQEFPAMTLEKTALSIQGMNIHRRIRERREALGLSMQALAARVGVSAWQTVQQWEKEDGGTAPKRERLKRVAEALKTTPEYLLCLTDEVQPGERPKWERMSSTLTRMPVLWPPGVDNPNDTLNVVDVEASAFLFPVSDSSNVPRYLPGDFAIVEPQTVPDIEDDVLVRFKADGRIALMRLLSRRGGIRLGVWGDNRVMTVELSDLMWMHCVGGFIPARRIVRDLNAGER